MENFYYDIPTKIHFGSGQIRHLAEAIKNCGHAVLLVYGGGVFYTMEYITMSSLN